jgi:hypothetical protein
MRQRFPEQFGKGREDQAPPPLEIWTVVFTKCSQVDFQYRIAIAFTSGSQVNHINL